MLIARGVFTALRIKHTYIPIDISAKMKSDDRQRRLLEPRTDPALSSPSRVSLGGGGATVGDIAAIARVYQ